MSKKECFINEIKNAIKDPEEYFSTEALDFWYQLIEEPEKPKFTENGKNILKFIQEHKDTYNNLFKAKDVGADLDMSSKSVSGSMRKLVSDGYLEKVGTNPVIYSITPLGIETKIE